jgi:hypothetical protein
VSRGPRGSNASTGDFDVQIEISGTDTRVATITKANDAQEGLLAVFKPKIHDFGIDEDGDRIEVCLAEPVTDVAVPTKGKLKTWAKSLALLRRLLVRMIDDRGTELHPYLDGPRVRAVDIKVVRAEFYKEYPADPDATAEQQQDARKKAFGRSVKGAQEAGLINLRDIDCVQWVWLI